MDVYMGMIAVFGFNYAPVYWMTCNGQVLQVNQYQALYALLGNQFGGTVGTSFGLPNLGGRTLRGLGQSTGTSYVPMGQSAGAESAQAAGTAVVNFTLSANQIPGHTHPSTFTATTGNVNVTIPATPGSGSIAVNPAPTIDVVAGNGGINPVAGQSYWLTGVKTPSTGPVTATAPTAATKASLAGLNVSIDTSSYQPSTPSTTVPVPTVTGGAVTVASQNSSTAPVTTAAACQVNVNLLNPYLGVNFCIAVQGLYPTRN
jgi:microcystin-dependent protein